VKYSIVTFGCRVNQADSLQIERDLRARGGVDAPIAEADVVVVNTCSVTATADQGARQTIRRIARDQPSTRIVVTGCYATRRPEEVGHLPNVVQVVSNDHKHQLVDRVQTTAERFGDGEGACGADIVPGRSGRTAFTLRVQTGCEERCSYCIIPTTRGYSRSVAVDAIRREAERIAAAGYKEIALTGVHLGSYGRDLRPRTSLYELLAALARVRADLTFRVSSLEPMDCTADIVELMSARDDRFAPHFHLPLQHASDRMLDAMRRPYTAAQYGRLLDSIVARHPHASIGSDMIVGFPGESDADFEESVRFLSSSPLSHIHVFPYSDRPGTAATAMSGKVHGAVIRDRAARLRAIGADLSRRFRDRQIGTIRPGLTLDDGTVVVTDNYLKVRIPAGLARNTRVNVRLMGDGYGEVVSINAARR
jgi:threonylcarbamoyladenosine tRNA methylthiotransferase MtaB